MDILQILTKELGWKTSYIANVIALLDEGNSIPFIARYRKEQHGAMDDTTLRNLEQRLTSLRNLEKRMEEVIRSITEQDRLTPELAEKIRSAETLSEVEDLYRPFKQKRRTRATVAREKGLAPLAELLLAQEKDSPSPNELAKKYLDGSKGVHTVEDALNGAKDVIAEIVSDHPEARKRLRSLLQRSACLHSAAAGSEDSVYRLYYDFSIPLNRLRGHQILAINRGEKERFLKVGIEITDAQVLPVLNRMFVIPGRPASGIVREAVEDSYHRLIFPSLERELRSALTDSANEGAMKNFALNLRPLLMQSPVKGFVTLGFDPGYRNGCKLAVVDGTGKVLDTAVIYPTPPFNKLEESKSALSGLIAAHGIRHIALGNGTASAESEKLLRELCAANPQVQYTIVNEAGASVYSASPLAAEEFPQYDVNLRSAVSIARRLQDPLAELVKIDPKSIGVGQYQHDMPQAQLSEILGGVVEDCVNAVGADLNTASPSLLTYISGLNKVTAKNVVAYREKHGAFRCRSELLRVEKLGPKAFEQCAGFLRVTGGSEPLDATGIHPESYAAARILLKLCGLQDAEPGAEGLHTLPAEAERLGLDALAEQCGVGIPTLRDMIRDLCKPGRDPRQELPVSLSRPDVTEISALKVGMVLSGTVRNVIDFGAFVDIGVHQDGLVHISQICNHPIGHPSEVLHVGDVVQVVVLSVDVSRKRISLSIRQVPENQ